MRSKRPVIPPSAGYHSTGTPRAPARTISERKVHRPQLTQGGNIDIIDRDPRERDAAAGQTDLQVARLHVMASRIASECRQHVVPCGIGTT
jgi:hypothetical protein